MGENYYLRRKKPKVYEKALSEIVKWEYEHLLAHPMEDVTLVDHEPVHIAKCSWGWTPSFQAVPASRAFDETERNQDKYEINSVEDIRGYLRTGEYEVVDEYGAKLTPEQFEHDVVQWEDRQRENGYGREFGNHVDEPDSLGAYLDPEGYQFCRTCFC